jgi:hypothetical protein
MKRGNNDYVDGHRVCDLVSVASVLDQWYSTFFVRVPPDIISLQLCTPKVVGT